MQATFPFYLKLGFDHIADLNGLDHILFLIALCAVYRIEQWRKILILVTAFTIGHSVTLALASLDFILLPSSLIKFLIPLTILVAALNNVIGKGVDLQAKKMKRNYVMALFFGFIHGLDFSNYFKALLFDSGNIIVPLLGFNLGIELAQLLVVLGIVLVAYLGVKQLKIKHQEWNVFISGMAAGLAIISLFENKIW